MKSLTRLILLSIITPIFFACGDRIDKESYDKIVAERDSIAKVAKINGAEVDGLNAYLGDIANCIDSISYHEKNLFAKVDPETGKVYTRAEIKERIKTFGEIIARQRMKLAELSDSLNSSSHKNISSEEIKKFTSMIDFLNDQLEAKEGEINKLKSELASSKRSIAQLTENVTSLKATTETLSKENLQLDNTISTQSEKLNEGYLLIRTKKELEDMGILKGGFLKKAKFDSGSVNISAAQKVDTRHFNEVKLPSGKPKLLSQAPANSYIIEKIDKNNSKFIILDTSAFWSLSKIVVIQL